MHAYMPGVQQLSRVSSRSSTWPNIRYVPYPNYTVFQWESYFFLDRHFVMRKIYSYQPLHNPLHLPLQLSAHNQAQRYQQAWLLFVLFLCSNFRTVREHYSMKIAIGHTPPNIIPLLINNKANYLNSVTCLNVSRVPLNYWCSSTNKWTY